MFCNGSYGNILNFLGWYIRPFVGIGMSFMYRVPLCITRPIISSKIWDKTYKTSKLTIIVWRVWLIFKKKANICVDTFDMNVIWKTNDEETLFFSPIIYIFSNISRCVFAMFSSSTPPSSFLVNIAVTFEHHSVIIIKHAVMFCCEKQKKQTRKPASQQKHSWLVVYSVLYARSLLDVVTL